MPSCCAAPSFRLTMPSASPHKHTFVPAPASKHTYTPHPTSSWWVASLEAAGCTAAHLKHTHGTSSTPLTPCSVKPCTPFRALALRCRHAQQQRFAHTRRAYRLAPLRLRGFSSPLPAGGTCIRTAPAAPTTPLLPTLWVSPTAGPRGTFYYRAHCHATRREPVGWTFALCLHYKTRTCAPPCHIPPPYHAAAPLDRLPACPHACH